MSELRIAPIDDAGGRFRLREIVRARAWLRLRATWGSAFVAGGVVVKRLVRAASFVASGFAGQHSRRAPPPVGAR